MYLIEYFNIFISGPWLLIFTFVVSALLMLLMFKMDSGFIYLGIPLLISSVIATFFPTDTLFCIKEDILRSYCYAEMGTGILILIGFSYLISAAIYGLYKLLERRREADYDFDDVFDFDDQ